MALPKDIIDKFINVTSSAAISTYKFIGMNDKINADKAAVDSMRSELNKLDINGKIVIGEGELDNAPMLFIGENVGTGRGFDLDIAVDPVEGTNFVAKNLKGGLSVLSVAEKGNLFNAPETYMNKIAVGCDLPADCVDLDYSIEKNINNLADFKNKKISEITACILDRQRHKNIIEKLLQMKVKIKLLTDGDVAGALLVTDGKYNVDIFLGIGGGPEGVLAASALDAFNCFFQGRFLFNDEKDITRANSMGINELDKKYYLNEIVKGDSIFCATGITDSDLVKGVKLINNVFVTETFVTHKNSSNNVIINNIANT